MKAIVKRLQVNMRENLSDVVPDLTDYSLDLPQLTWQIVC